MEGDDHAAEPTIPKAFCFVKPGGCPDGME